MPRTSKTITGTPEARKCEYCGELMPPTRRKWKRYCGTKCKTAAYDRAHPRQKIGANFTFTIAPDGTLILPAGMRFRLVAMPK